MFHRVAALILTVLAFLVFAAPTALADPNAPVGGGQLPQGFPAELRKYVVGTEEFRDAPWFRDPSCIDQGGNVGMYLNAVMLDEPRLMYWSLPPDSRKLFWGGPFGGAEADPNKEPPTLPKLFPASAADRDAYRVPTGEGGCATKLQKWANLATNAWGFTWVSAPDPASLERMKALPPLYPSELPVEEFTGACVKAKSPFCEKAFFVDCAKVASDPAQHPQCIEWNVAIGKLFTGMAAFIENNSSWLDNVKRFLEFVGDKLYSGGKWAVDAFAGVAMAPVEVGKFVADPSSAIDDLANALHQGATAFTTTVLQGLASVGNFDPTAPWFLGMYAASSGIGIVVMAFMALLMLWRTAHGNGGREELQEALFKRLPLGLFLAVFSPAIATVLLEMTRGLTNGIAAWDAGYLNRAVVKLGLLGKVSVAMMPGGVFIAILIFLLMILGAFSVFAGLVVQSVALPLAGAVAGLSWGMLIHPKYRAKALKPPMMFVGLALSPPLLFLLLGFIWAFIDGNLSIPAMQSGGLPLLTQLASSGFAMLMAGLAPYSALKYAPLLPTEADSHAPQPSSGFGTSSVVGAGIGAMAVRGTGSSSGGGGPSGGGEGHSIQRNYTQNQNPPQGASRPQPRTGTPAARHPGGPGGTGSPGSTGPAGSPGSPGRSGGTTSGGRQAAATAGGRHGGAVVNGGAATGTTAGAAQAGASSGAAAGPWGVLAQVAVAGFNKARTAAHRAPEVDEDVVRGDRP
ncbi:hypothetical protein CFP71_40565 [Amycolatopsis thailandensis]|uniref:Type IV secretion system protein n=1 Tax=Amycolatopsis thailandensis TaxID=589330 RepID=A0A229RCM7_9PSEU|nr:hypothetical protein [Amycolatopsis thailandensis]OXM44249.1 hypothetical protein CFP71_40565 [Amycolatopsis thailandensis]